MLYTKQYDIYSGIVLISWFLLFCFGTLLMFVFTYVSVLLDIVLYTCALKYYQTHVLNATVNHD